MISTPVYRPGTRGLHHIHPGSGMLLLACFLYGVLGTGSLIVRAALLVLVMVLAVWTEGSVRVWFKSLRFVLVFAALMFLAQVLSIREGEVLFTIGVPVTAEGMLAGVNMALRFLVILSASFLFVVTTDPDRLAGSLIRWGIPYRYGFTLILALRFVPFFRNELRIVREAQQLRGIHVSIRSIAGIRRAIRYTFVPVLVSGLIRVDTIAMSMKGRAFGLHRRRTAPPRVPLTLEDGLILICSGLVIVMAVTAGRAQWL